MRILIATGIYPPDVGGPAQYAANLEKVWKSWGYWVTVKTFRFERVLPSGVRHIFYFFKCLPVAATCDFIFILDTWSAALPAMLLGFLFRKKTIIRTGGDFLYESYVERTGDLVLLRDFYRTRLGRLSRKERLVFSLTRWIITRVSVVVFSTDWQRDLWREPYGLKESRTAVVFNFFGEKIPATAPKEKNFLWAVRPLKLKNGLMLEAAFAEAKKISPEISLDTKLSSQSELMARIASCYGVILPSISDISPNLITDAIRYGKPFILTRETGLYECLKECAIFVDPENVNDIAKKILWLSQPAHYAEQKKKVEAFVFRHSWEDIASEILAIAQECK